VSRCLAPGCEVAVSGDVAFCARHFRQLPAETQDAMSRAYTALRAAREAYAVAVADALAALPPPVVAPDGFPRPPGSVLGRPRRPEVSLPT
jgi:hypothetical protein